MEDTSQREREEIEQRIFPNATIVYETIRLEGEDELRRPVMGLFWSGLAAGLSMGFSLIMQGLLQSCLPETQWRPLIVRIGYTSGFLIVVLGRQQLFTENTVTPILPLLLNRNRETAMAVLRLWAVVLAANLLGTLLVAWVVGASSVFALNVQTEFIRLAQEQTVGSFWEIVLRGIFAGWLIALMVWLMPAAQTARITVIFFLTYLIGIAGLTHIVAGSVELLYLVTTHRLAFSTCLGSYMFPTLIGNIIGGVALVTAMGHAQVLGGKDRTRRRNARGG